MEPLSVEERRQWREYCAVVQLSIQEFLDIQDALLGEQLELFASKQGYSPFLKGRPPTTVEEFRSSVPLCRWQDFVPVLQPSNSNGFAGDLHCWVHTSWCHGSWKQVPWSRRFFDAQCRHVVAALMMSVARYEGDVRLSKKFRVLPMLPDTPFASAWLAAGVVKRDVVSSALAPREQEAELSMSQRLHTLFRRSFESGVDCVVGMSSTLLLARREFQRMMVGTSAGQLLSQAGPAAAARWTWSWLRRRGSRSAWEPRTLLAPKAVITWGADTSFLTPMLEAQWGAPVLQLYASSEGGIIAMQDWRRRELVPLPTSVFLEFLPWGAPGEPAALVSLDQLKDGELYEPVITSFYGMPFLRLRQGDLLRVEGHNPQGVPLFSFYSRADDIIDLGSIARIDRATLAEALELVGVQDGQWTARKEYVEGLPVMCLYVDAEPEHVKEIHRKLHRALGRVDPHYREAFFTLGYPLLRVYANGSQGGKGEENGVQ